MVTRRSRKVVTLFKLLIWLKLLAVQTYGFADGN